MLNKKHCIYKITHIITFIQTHLKTYIHTSIYKYMEEFIHKYLHTRNVPDFGRVFLMLKYIDMTEKTYIQK